MWSPPSKRIRISATVVIRSTSRIESAFPSEREHLGRDRREDEEERGRGQREPRRQRTEQDREKERERDDEYDEREIGDLVHARSLRGPRPPVRGELTTFLTGDSLQAHATVRILGAMRLMALLMLALVLSASVAAGACQASDRRPGLRWRVSGGFSGRGRARHGHVGGKGVLVGRMEKGSLEIADLSSGDQWSPRVYGIPRGKTVALRRRRTS